MQQDKPTINLTVPTGWDKLDDLVAHARHRPGHTHPCRRAHCRGLHPHPGHRRDERRTHRHRARDAGHHRPAHRQTQRHRSGGQCAAVLRRGQQRRQQGRVLRQPLQPVQRGGDHGDRSTGHQRRHRPEGRRDDRRACHRPECRQDRHHSPESRHAEGAGQRCLGGRLRHLRHDHLQGRG